VTVPVVTLLTDYGPHSEHVGALHAAVVAADPGITRVDFAHDIPPGDIRWGAVILARLAVQLPGAVHVAVVDPGVGTARRALAIALVGGGAIVGPDNGLLGPAAVALGTRAAAELEVPVGVPATFAGRDLFVPVALRLIAGVDLAAVGAAVDPAGIRLPEIPPPEVAAGVLSAAVLGADRFGNLQLFADARATQRAGLEPGSWVIVSGTGTERPARVVRTFADAPEGALVVYLDSHGHVAVGVNCGNAAATLGARGGDRLSVRVAPATTPAMPGSASWMGRGRPYGPRTGPSF
jgi:S-adenosylmethionine hydrolase